MVTFDCEKLRDSLLDLDSLERAAFAASCAERLFGIMNAGAQAVSEERAAMRAALDTIWDSLTRREQRIQIPFADDGEKWIRGDEAEWCRLNPLLDNAIAGTIYACRCFHTGEVAPAIWAATQGYEAADYISQKGMRAEFGSGEYERAVQSSAYVQAELQYQEMDLRLVNGVAGTDITRLNQLKTRSERAGLELAEFCKQFLAD